MSNQIVTYHASGRSTRGGSRPSRPFETASLVGSAASPGDICLMEVPFTDGAETKVRPVLVLATQGSDLVIAPLTTRPPRSAFDVELSHWFASGLQRRSTVRCARLSSLSRRLVFAILGHTIRDDWRRVRTAADQWFRRIVLSSTY